MSGLDLSRECLVESLRDCAVPAMIERLASRCGSLLNSSEFQWLS